MSFIVEMKRRKVLRAALGSIAAFWVLFIGIGLSVGAAVVIHLHEVRIVDFVQGYFIEAPAKLGTASSVGTYKPVNP